MIINISFTLNHTIQIAKLHKFTTNKIVSVSKIHTWMDCNKLCLQHRKSQLPYVNEFISWLRCRHIQHMPNSLGNQKYWDSQNSDLKKING